LRIVTTSWHVRYRLLPACQIACKMSNKNLRIVTTSWHVSIQATASMPDSLQDGKHTSATSRTPTSSADCLRLVASVPIPIPAVPAVAAIFCSCLCLITAVPCGCPDWNVSVCSCSNGQLRVCSSNAVDSRLIVTVIVVVSTAS
jgi:hypothetical protein